MENLDSLGRRRRFTPQPRDPVRIVEGDLLMARFVQQFGGAGLPTWAVFDGCQSDSWRYFSRRMTALRHSEFFKVNHWQFRASPFREDKALLHRNPLYNEIGPHAEEALRARGWWMEGVPGGSSSKPHDAYLSTLYYSFWKMLPEGWEMEMQHEIKARLDIPPDIQVGSLYGKPDFFFILKTPVREILVFNETDRATEPVRTKDSTRRSWDQKLEFYFALNGGAPNGKRHYQNIFNFSGGMLLTINTVSWSNLLTILDLVKEKRGSSNFIMGQVCEGFGDRLEFPNDPFSVYASPWARAGRDPYNFLNANA